MFGKIRFVIQKLQSYGVIKQFIILFSAGIIFQIAYGSICNLVDGHALDNPVSKHSIQEQFFLAVLIAPLLETYLCQYLPMTKLKWKISYRFFFSAVLFGLLHGYSVYYQIAAIAMGLLLALPFVLYHNNAKRAFWFAALLHLFNNVLVILNSVFDK